MVRVHFPNDASQAMAKLKKDNGGLLGTVEAARFLEIHRSTLTYWRLKGELIPTETRTSPRGVSYRYSLEDLQRFRDRIDYN
jgi:hypothetical protein